MDTQPKFNTLHDIPAPYQPTTMDIEEPGRPRRNRRNIMIIAGVCALLMLSSLVCLTVGGFWLCAKKAIGEEPQQSNNSMPCFRQSSNGSLVPTGACPVHIDAIIGDFNAKMDLLQKPGKNGTESQGSVRPTRNPVL